MRPKDGLKRLARPISSRLTRKVDERSEHAVLQSSTGLEERIASLESTVVAERARLSRERNRLSSANHRLASEVQRVSKDLDSFDHHIPVVLNTIASQNAARRDHERRLKSLESGLAAFEGLGDNLAYLERRLETVRKETLFEIRYGPGPESSTVPEPEIIEPERLDAMGGKPRLNLGAGHIALTDYLNVDVRNLPGIDIVADVRKLPFGPGEVDEIFSAHLLEHFPREEMRRSLLPYWVSLLRSGGRFVAIVPDMETMAVEFSAGRMPGGEFMEVVYGGQEYAGDFHFSGFTRSSLVGLLEEAGLDQVTVVESGRRNGMCFEMEVRGTRPERIGVAARGDEVH